MLWKMIFLILFIMTWLHGGLTEQRNTCELCKCLENVVDCTSKSLDDIPKDIPANTNVLILDHNNISSVPNFIFNSTRGLRVISISHNFITKLNHFSFYGLRALKRLRLMNNSMNLVPENYPTGVFLPLENLKYLDISHNVLDSQTHLQYPHEAFSHLKSLEYLLVDGITNLTFGVGFANMSSLAHLVVSGNCITETINRDTFIHVSNLRELVVKGCWLRSIHKSAFENFVQLQVLDISFNIYLGFDEACGALASLTCPTMEVLDVSAIVQSFAVGIIIQGKHIQSIKHMKLKEIYLDHNRIELFEMEIISQVPHTLKYLSMKDNRLTYGTYILAATQMNNLVCCDTSDTYLSHAPIKNPYSSLKATLLEYNKPICPYKRIPRYSSSSNDYTEIAYADTFERNPPTAIASEDSPVWINYTNPPSKLGINMVINLPPNLEFINGSSSKLGYPIPKLKFGSNKIRFIDASTNILSKWIGPITGVRVVEWLSLSYNYCDEIHEDFFSEDFSNLRELHIASNFLAYPLENDIQGNIFRFLTNLTVMNIADNKIRLLPPRLLRAQRNLKKIYLSKNMMKMWTLELDHMTNLEYIDLSNNMLSELPDKFRNFADQQYHNGKMLRVNLLNQTLKCICENLDFLKWMQKNTTHFVGMENYECEDSNGKMLSLVDLNEIILDLDKKCASYTIMIIFLTFGILILVSTIAVSILYRYRWKLRYLYYLTRNRYRGYIAVEANPTFDFDGFVSYADEDRGIVTRDMVQKLEQDHGLRLCIHHRDFLVGEDIAANILDAVRRSKKTLILLSRNFLQSYWCIFELNMALIEARSTGRNVLIVIVYEHVAVERLPEELIALMRNDSYVEYTDDPEGQIVFWDNLVRAINSD